VDAAEGWTTTMPRPLPRRFDLVDEQQLELVDLRRGVDAAATSKPRPDILPAAELVATTSGSAKLVDAAEGWTTTMPRPAAELLPRGWWTSPQPAAPPRKGGETHGVVSLSRCAVHVPCSQT